MAHVSETRLLLDRLAMGELQPSELTDVQIELLDVMSSALMDNQREELADCTAKLEQMNLDEMTHESAHHEKEKQRRRALNCLQAIMALIAVHSERTRREILRT